MLFNSYEFILWFLPVVILLTLVTSRVFGKTCGIVILIVSSLYFYAYWNINYLPLLLGSIVSNYFLAINITKHTNSEPYRKKILLLFGLVINLGLLAYYKYAGFLSAGFSDSEFLGTNSVLMVAIPLGISFYTFQQIAYLVDSYRGETEKNSFLEYVLFVSFFPQLIAGPIVCHKEFFYQITHRRFLRLDYVGLSTGISFFVIGLFKKVVIADRLSIYADRLFDGSVDHAVLMVGDYWVGLLAYTFQIYFDFSGYSDMAIGLARIFGIKLPINFNSPYKAVSIIDFWRRWHITLSNFLKNYLYIPLGGNKQGVSRKYVNLMITMILGGIWHGAGFTFLLWGALHGLYLIVNHVWNKKGFELKRYLAVPVTFLFVVLAWVPFRSNSIDHTLQIWAGLFDFTTSLRPSMYSLDVPGHISILFLTSLIVVFFSKNTNEVSISFYRRRGNAIVISGLFLVALLSIGHVNKFIYYQF